MKVFNQHTFVICAYKESGYLEECVKSLLNQTVKSKIILCTSTPNSLINDIAQKYHIEIKVNPEGNGIGKDWNFAVNQASTQFVTIAHQDDLYNSNYVEKVQNSIKSNRDFIMIFTNYKEIRNNKISPKNINLIIKSILIFPIRLFKRKKWAKRLILSFGNPICCPSVCLNIKEVGKSPYREDMSSNIDWETWIDFSEKKGSFVYLKDVLTYHRIYDESQTSKSIKSKERYEEDYKILRRLWPEWFAKFLMKFYRLAGNSNKLEHEK